MAVGRQIPRRSFLAAALAAGAFPFLPGCRSAFGRGKVRLALIGVGGRGGFDLGRWAANGDLCEIAALCDADMGGAGTLAALKAYPDLPRFRDFRKMLDLVGDSVDAVAIATPDHSHFVAAMHAMRLGKHVYVETPLAHTFRECELLARAERETGVVCQMGDEGRSGARRRQFAALGERGEFKDAVKVIVRVNRPGRLRPGPAAARPPKTPRPMTLDWNAWLASAAPCGYNPAYANGGWRDWFDFGGGALGDLAVSCLGGLHEAVLGSGLPLGVTPLRATGWSACAVPDESTLSFAFEKAELEWRQGPQKGAAVEVVRRNGRSWSSAKELPPIADPPSDAFRNFLLSVCGDETPHTPFRVAAPLCQTLALGRLAQQLNRPVRFDPIMRRVVGDAEAQRLLDGPAPRAGWEEYYRS